MITVDDLMDAIEQYANDKAELRECVNGCEYDAGYFCSENYSAVEKSKAKLETALKAYIAQVVASTLMEIAK